MARTEACQIIGYPTIYQIDRDSADKVISVKAIPDPSAMTGLMISLYGKGDWVYSKVTPIGFGFTFGTPEKYVEALWTSPISDGGLGLTPTAIQIAQGALYIKARPDYASNPGNAKLSYRNWINQYGNYYKNNPGGEPKDAAGKVMIMNPGQVPTIQGEGNSTGMQTLQNPVGNGPSNPVLALAPLDVNQDGKVDSSVSQPQRVEEVFNPGVSGSFSFGKDTNKWFIPFAVIGAIVLILIFRPFGLFSGRK